MQEIYELLGSLLTMKRSNNKQKVPAWKAKLKREIKEIMCELSVVDEISRNSGISTRKCKEIKRKYKIKFLNEFPTIKKILRQLKFTQNRMIKK